MKQYKSIKETVISVEMLAKALKNSISKENFSSKDADNIAEHVINFFGYNERIIDNVLEPVDRDIFYELENYGVLATEREETHLYDGRIWRTHYWWLNKHNIIKMANTTTRNSNNKKTTQKSNIYDKFDDKIWQRK